MKNVQKMKYTPFSIGTKDRDIPHQETGNKADSDGHHHKSTRRRGSKHTGGLFHQKRNKVETDRGGQCPLQLGR